MIRKTSELQAEYETKSVGCIFCQLSKTQIVSENELALAFRDASPVTPLHTLVIPRRHAVTWFDLHQAEVTAINRLLVAQRAALVNEDPSISGFNIGVNCGSDAGQTVFHAHVHLIPRRRGDVSDPRGGVRHLLPGKGFY